MGSRASVSWLVLSIAIPIVLQLNACDDGVTDARDAVTDGGTYSVAYTPSPDPIPLMEFFALEVRVASSTDPLDLVETASIQVDAWMPGHGHGMDVTPQVTAQGDGTFHVDNMELSMTGEWEILVDVLNDGATETATFVVQCCE